MKRYWMFGGFLLVLVAEVVALIVFAVQNTDLTQDTVAVNAVVQAVTADFNALDQHQPAAALDYVVLDNDGKVLYQTKAGLPTSVNAALAHRDTLLPITVDGQSVGQVIIINDVAQIWQAQRQTVIITLAVAIVVNGALCLGYAVVLYLTVIRPFRQLKGFAERVAGGNLDIPLTMDRHNLFGAFTESFDLMRTELKKARLAEAQANASKKELVAKLSHDIKTPVASIKAVAEVGLAVTRNAKDQANYTQIQGKADQINTLVTNLFTATLEELQQLSVTPQYIASTQVKNMLANADYRHCATLPELPECLVYADPLRLQQVFDNIFANAYKYAQTEIMVTAAKTDDTMVIVIEDFGGGVPAAELPTLKKKFRRGSNTANIEGAGLGLYIADQFMQAMQGELLLENGAHGLKVTVTLSLRAPI